MKRVLNFGAGTQSSVLYDMMCEGEIEPAEVALFSDLGWEPKAVYDHLAWMKSRNCSIPIVVIEAGNLRRDALISQVRGKKPDGVRWASMPLYTKRVWLPSEAELFEQTFIGGGQSEPDEWSLFPSMADLGGTLSRRVELAKLIRGHTVVHMGMIRRQCTSEYKIAPIRRWIRENMLGLSHGQRAPSEPVITQVFGISFDERQRVKSSTDRWSAFEYPFVDMKMDRRAVISRAERTFPGRVYPRSACIGCPYHSNEEWRDMRDNRPIEWADAVEFDKAIRNCGGMRGQMFLHRDCLPLDEVDLSTNDERSGQMNAFGMVNECEGMCGV